MSAAFTDGGCTRMMRSTAGLNRIEAANFIGRRLGRTFHERVLRYWESRGLIRPFKSRPGGRGPHCPVVYQLPDLIAAEVLTTLRTEGVSLQQLRHALANLKRLFPDVMNTPARWKLGVALNGDVFQTVRLENDAALVSLARSPGQVAVFNAGELASHARAAMEKRRVA